MEYTVVASDKLLSNFIEEINDMIEDGWQPLGGICVSEAAEDYLFYQAMIKKN